MIYKYIDTTEQIVISLGRKWNNFNCTINISEEVTVETCTIKYTPQPVQVIAKMNYF